MLSKRHLLFFVFGVLAIASAPAGAETFQITIDKLAFSPTEVHAKIGDTIEWINNDPFAHTATLKGGWDIMIPPNKSGTTIVGKAGTFDYFCRFHPNMKGRINVTAN